MKVAVILGGTSFERDVSLKTGKAVVKACKVNNYDVETLIIDENHKKFLPILKQADIVFNALHGTLGEDGNIQRWLEENNIKFTGSDENSTKKCWDKVSSKILMVENEIPTPEFQVISANQKLDRKNDFFLKKHSFFVKPNNNGSSFGVSKVDLKKNLGKAITEARKYSKDVIIEKAYNTAEYTVGILKGEALQPLEIIAEDNKGFYDFEAKYLSKATKKVEVVDKNIKRN